MNDEKQITALSTTYAFLRWSMMSQALMTGDACGFGDECISMFGYDPYIDHSVQMEMKFGSRKLKIMSSERDQRGKNIQL